MSGSVRVVTLVGGGGGAKLAHGLYMALPPDASSDALAIIVNTGDDFDWHGLRVCPDADTVLYTLAGLANVTTGWGIAGDSWSALEMLGAYGQQTWFRVGDRDLATHILRTEQLRAGWRPTEVLAGLGQALRIRAALLPMCDEPIATVVRTPEGELAFQDYFVRRQHRDTILAFRFEGVQRARVSDEVRAAVESADAIVLGPSNPMVSIGPILAVPGMRELVRRARAPKVAISPIVGGEALKGPAAQMFADLGIEVSPFGVASQYQGLLSGFVLDTVDAGEAPRIEALGMRTLVTDTVMRTVVDRERLAREVLAFAEELARG